MRELFGINIKPNQKKLRTNYRVHIQEVPKTEGHEFDSQYFQSKNGSFGILF